VPNSSTKHTSAAMLRQVQRVVKFWREYAGTYGATIWVRKCVNQDEKL
jgi:hypothetical protein